MNPKLSQLGYGGGYNPEQWPPAVWSEDVELMKRAGVNLVTVGLCGWGRLQPSEGTYTLDWLEQVLTLLSDNGILVALSTATAFPPPWFTRLNPEARATSDGLICPSNQAYRKLAAQLVRQLASRFGKHPALALWQVGHGFGEHVPSCFCDACANQFRTWLQHKYKTLDALNEHWGTAACGHWLQQWEDVSTPRSDPSRGNPAQQLDYRRFMSDSLLACLLNEKSILSELTPQIPVTTNFRGDHGVPKPIDGFDWSRHVDVIACSSFPDPLEADPADMAFGYDLQRGLGAGRPWILMQQAVSQTTLRPHNAVKRPGQLRLWSYQAVAHGADAILFEHWRSPQTGPEKFHGGIVPHGGIETRTFQEVEQLGHELKKLSAIRGATTKAEVALLFDWENMWAVEMDSCPARINYAEMVRSYYRALFEPDVPVDIVSLDADFSAYKLLVAPALYLVRHGVADRLETFVDNGGTSVLTFLSGIVDANDRILPGGFPAPFRRLLGIQVEEFDAFGHQVRHIKTPLRGARCTLWADLIHLEGAEAVATFTEDFYAQQPAITRNAVGRGLAYYVGTHPEPSFLRAFLSEICLDCGVRRPMRVPGGVEVTTRWNQNGEFLFLLNHNAAIQFVDIGPRIRRDLLTGEMVKGQCELGPRDVRVLQLA